MHNLKMKLINFFLASRQKSAVGIQRGVQFESLIGGHKE